MTIENSCCFLLAISIVFVRFVNARTPQNITQGNVTKGKEKKNIFFVLVMILINMVDISMTTYMDKRK